MKTMSFEAVKKTCKELEFNEEITQELLWNAAYQLGRSRWYWGPGWLVKVVGRLNTWKYRILSLLGIIAMCGCARFGTNQQDLRYDPDTGKLTGKITTKASSYTLFSSKSDLAKWKASQTEKSQGAEVGGLSQQGGTNVAATITALAELLRALNPAK